MGAQYHANYPDREALEEEISSQIQARKRYVRIELIGQPAIEFKVIDKVADVVRGMATGDRPLTIDLRYQSVTFE